MANPHSRRNNLDLTLSAANLLTLRGILNDLHRHPGFYQDNNERLAAADLAYFAHGASLDDGPTGDDTMHEDFMAFRHGTSNAIVRSTIRLRMRRAIFDHAAKLDHMTGSTTFIVNIPGALEPLSPPSPEFMKAHVYIPGTLLREYEREGRSNPIPDIVQMMIRELGLPTAERFDRARKKIWDFPVNRHAPPPRPLPEIIGMPDPIPSKSNRYTFYGHRLTTFPDPTAYFAVGGETPPTGDEEDIGLDDSRTIDTDPLSDDEHND